MKIRKFWIFSIFVGKTSKKLYYEERSVANLPKFKIYHKCTFLIRNSCKFCKEFWRRVLNGDLGKILNFKTSVYP